MLHRGLDLRDLQHTSEQEKAAFKDEVRRNDGRSHVGFDFLLDNEPGGRVLKGYSLMIRGMVQDGIPPGLGAVEALGYIGCYATVGYVRGITYMARRALNAGLTKDQIIEGLAIPFLRCGPRGMEAIAEGLRDTQWTPRGAETVWPEGWGSDRTAFAAGIDRTCLELRDDERERITAWYERTLGEVPAYISYLAARGPSLLKGYRIRFEDLVPTLPNQLVPTTLLLLDVLIQNRSALREDVLLCRAWRVTRREVDATLAFANPQGIEKLGLVAEVAGDVLAEWNDQDAA